MANEERFTGLARQYAQYRPSYPAECLDWLVAENRLAPGDAVADVGAGTGIFSALLLARGLTVRAVEPNADMAAEAEKALGGKPGFSLHPASAEQTGLGAGSVRLVCACQAFHWFDPAAYAAECRRILTPEGRAAVIWNTRDPRTPLGAEYEALRQRWRQGVGGWRNTPGQPSEGVVSFFGGGFETRLFDNPLCYQGLDALLGHALSASYAPKAGPDRDGYLADLGAFFERWQQGGVLTMPMVTEAYLGRPAAFPT